MDLRGTLQLGRDCVQLRPGAALEFDVRELGGRTYHLKAGSMDQLEARLKAIDKSYKSAVAFRRIQSKYRVKE